MLLTQPRRPPFPSFPLAHAASFTKEPRDTSRSGSDKCVFGKVSSQTQAAVGPGQRNIWMISARIYIYSFNYVFLSVNDFSTAVETRCYEYSDYATQILLLEFYVLVFN